MQQIKIVNNLDTVVIDIEGTIGIAEEAQFENPQQRVATYERFREKLSEIEQIDASNVVVNIRSTGGDVNDALLIYDALTSLKATITTRCWGYVASAATIIAQAASSGLREISPNALYLIHNTTTYVEGNADQLAKRLELLNKSDERVAALYAQRSGRDASIFAELMGEQGGQGRWLDANEVIEMSLADIIIDQAHEAEEATQTEESTDGEPILDPITEAITGVVDRVRALFTRGGGLAETPMVEVIPENIGVSVTHDESIAPTPKSSTIAFEQRQKELERTQIEAIEDPSVDLHTVKTANQIAYDNDVRRLFR